MILKEYDYYKKIMKKHFNKNFIMSEKEEEQFQLSNVCWRSLHVTGKFRGAAYWSCNINLQLTKKFPAIFHNLRGYDSHLIFDKLQNFTKLM